MMTTEPNETLELWDNEDDDKFALRVVGDCMLDEHIQDGDFVIIRKGKPRTGEIVAVRGDEGEAVLKRFTDLGNGRARLESRHGSVTRDNVKVLGVLLGVVRKY